MSRNARPDDDLSEFLKNFQEEQESTQDFGNKVARARVEHKLEEEALDHARRQSGKDIISQGLDGIARVILTIVILTLVAVAWHFLLPTWLSWLTTEQLNGLIRFLLSSIVVGAVSSYFRQHS